MSTMKVILGVATGVVVGAALGVLFAPDKGTETRKRIAESGQDQIDALGHKFNAFVENMNAQLAALRNGATRMITNGKREVEVVEDQIESNVTPRKSRTHA